MSNVLVLGGARSLWSDLEAALRLGEYDGVVTCNDATVDWKGPIDAAVSLHAEKWPLWIRKRDLEGRSRPKRVYAHDNFSRSTLKASSYITHYSNHLFPGQKDSGSSGHFALKVALELFDKAVLCGIQLSSDPHYFDKKPWGGAPSHRRGWIQTKSQLGKARSMSGWTADLLGKPTEEWLYEG